MFGTIFALFVTVVLLTAPLATAQEPATVRLLAAQRVELLPQEPLCWNVFSASLPVGGRIPPEGYISAPLLLGYATKGTHRFEFAGGPNVNLQAGEGRFIGNENWFAHSNIGTVSADSLVFALTCQQFPPPGIPGVQHLTKTDILPGIRMGPTPYLVQLLEIKGVPGSMTAAQTTSGPLTAYFTEGTVAVTTPSGVKQYKAGDLVVIPPGTPFETATVGNVPATALVTLITPVGEPPQQRLAGGLTGSATPSALPRTGDPPLAINPFAILLGLSLFTVGISARIAMRQRLER